MTVRAQRQWTHEGRPELHRRGIPPVDGPWLAEPDKVQWIDVESDLDCLAVRNGFGAWCGYVGLPPGHPLHGLHWDEIEDRADVFVHGGLTFANRCDEDAEEGVGVCHVPLPGRPNDVWWLGFDCGHFMDLSPWELAQAASDPAFPVIEIPWGKRSYKTLGYVQDECHKLALQVAALAGAA